MQFAQFLEDVVPVLAPSRADSSPGTVPGTPPQPPTRPARVAEPAPIHRHPQADDPNSRHYERVVPSRARNQVNRLNISDVGTKMYGHAAVFLVPAPPPIMAPILARALAIYDMIHRPRCIRCGESTEYALHALVPDVGVGEGVVARARSSQRVWVEGKDLKDLAVVVACDANPSWHPAEQRDGLEARFEAVDDGRRQVLWLRRLGGVLDRLTQCACNAVRRSAACRRTIGRGGNIGQYWH